MLMMRSVRAVARLSGGARGLLGVAGPSLSKSVDRALATFVARAGMAQPQVATGAANPNPAMFCMQCEQTRDTKGCTTIGVCGKDPQTAALQDLLVEVVKGLAAWAHLNRPLGLTCAQTDALVLDSLFSTMTNVNFDPKRMTEYINKAVELRGVQQQWYEQKTGKKSPFAATHPANIQTSGKSMEELEAMGKTVGVLSRKEKLGEDFNGLAEMCIYGLKGTAAYAHHARVLGQTDADIYGGIHEVLSEIAQQDYTAEKLLGLNMKVGAINLKVMELLDRGATSKWGHPEPTQVRTTPVAGKAILISGHDLHDLELVLKQTEGTGINVYTHGEMLPAHSYPGLKKYKHLAGHYGGPWQLQKIEFSNFPGAILMTTNCLIEPRPKYKGRIFTRSVTGFPGVTHIAGDDMKPLIESAKAQTGFLGTDAEPKPLTVGFGRNTVLGIADTVIDAVKKGAISRFFLIGGCDGSEEERSYFRDVALNTPPNSVILTLGCGKYRVNNLNLGNLPGTGIPRVLDMGQCNDAFSAIQVAAALAKAFNTDVNGLPLSFAVSWFEQKAVAVLLTLLHLNIKNIRLGPRLPAFVSPSMLNVLVSKFNIMPIGKGDADVKLMMQSH